MKQQYPDTCPICQKPIIFEMMKSFSMKPALPFITPVWPVMVLGNVSNYRSAQIKGHIVMYKVQLEYLPTYPLDDNPTEKSFRWLEKKSGQEKPWRR